jgi:hypothetical protein
MTGGPQGTSSQEGVRDMPEDDDVGIPLTNASIADRIAAFNMLDSMESATQAAKIFRLSLVGFKRGEIAAMLQTTPQVVSQSIYSEKTKLKKRSQK